MLPSESVDDVPRVVAHELAHHLSYHLFHRMTATPPMKASDSKLAKKGGDRPADEGRVEGRRSSGERRPRGGTARPR